MAEPLRRYRLTYPDTGQGSEELGVVERGLTDEQAKRLQRYAEHPHARLQKIELIEDEEGDAT